MVICQTVLLLAVTLAVMLYFSRQTLKEEAIQDAEETLAGTVQQIDNVLLSIEQTTEYTYQDLLGHLDEPERMETYCRKVVEGNPYVVGCAIVFQPNFYQGRELFMAYVHRENDKLVASDSFGSKPYTEQIWYTKPMASQRAGWTDPSRWHHNAPAGLIRSMMRTSMTDRSPPSACLSSNRRRAVRRVSVWVCWQWISPPVCSARSYCRDSRHPTVTACC